MIYVWSRLAFAAANLSRRFFSATWHIRMVGQSGSVVGWWKARWSTARASGQFACAWAILWRPAAFKGSRNGSQKYCRARGMAMLGAAKSATGANVFSILMQGKRSPILMVVVAAASACFNLVVSPLFMVAAYSFIRKVVPGAAAAIDNVYDRARLPIDATARYYDGFTTTKLASVPHWPMGWGEWYCRRCAGCCFLPSATHRQRTFLSQFRRRRICSIGSGSCAHEIGDEGDEFDDFDIGARSMRKY